MNKVIQKFFEDDTVNKVALDVIELEAQAKMDAQKSLQYLESAFHRRWQQGKLLHENQEAILEHCGTWRNFCEGFGHSEGVISNNRRAYKALLDIGANDWGKVKEVLSEKGIRPTIPNFEKVGKLLNDPDAATKPKDQRPRDERRLEEIQAELDEIRTRNESASNNHVVELAQDTLAVAGDLSAHINKLNPEKSLWENRKYIEWVKSLGVDMITGKPCANPDFHHTTITGGQGGIGKKLPDTHGIPVSRETHMMIESGFLVPSQEELAQALIDTMSLFIQTNYNG